jgi:hypothetical protein
MPFMPGTFPGQGPMSLPPAPPPPVPMPSSTGSQLSELVHYTFDGFRGIGV